MSMLTYMTVMDLTRIYYASEKLTAPAFRLDYIYTAIHEPNAMRKFLVQTAAYRILCEQPDEDDSGPLISDSIRGALMKNNEMAVDFAEAAIELSKSDLADPRHGDDCAWHVHEKTAKCPPYVAEAWQSDGAEEFSVSRGRTMREESWME